MIGCIYCEWEGFSLLQLLASQWLHVCSHAVCVCVYGVCLIMDVGVGLYIACVHDGQFQSRYHINCRHGYMF